MDGRAAYIAVDWGTTNRRAFAVSGSGAVLDSLQDGRGILSLAPGDYPAEIADLRARLGPHPVIAVGMVGSNRGWLSAPYIAAPATLALACICISPSSKTRTAAAIAPASSCGSWSPRHSIVSRPTGGRRAACPSVAGPGRWLTSRRAAFGNRLSFDIDDTPRIAGTLEHQR